MHTQLICTRMPTGNRMLLIWHQGKRHLGPRYFWGMLREGSVSYKAKRVAQVNLEFQSCSSIPDKFLLGIIERGY